MFDVQENVGENSTDDPSLSFTSIWDAFLLFENMGSRRKGEKLDEYISRWKQNLTIAQASGCDYSDTILACKLLLKANLDKIEARNMVNSVAYCPSEMLSTLLFILQDYSVEDVDSAKEQAVKKEMGNILAKQIKEEFPKDSSLTSKSIVQSEEELLMEMQLKEEMPEYIQPSLELDFSQPVEEQDDDSTVDDINKEQETEIEEEIDDGGEGSKVETRRKSAAGKLHYCSACPLSFKHSTSLKKHFMKKHTDERPFQCSHCSFATVWRGELKRHARVHSGERPYKCPECDKAFGAKRTMLYHLEHLHKKEDENAQENLEPADVNKPMNNDGAKRYYCQLCPKSFTKNQTLQKHHMRKHTDERPFQCSQCSFSAVGQNELRAHVRRHTGEKPFKCPFCDKEFRDKKSLKYHHERSHSDQPSYKCSLCYYWTLDSGKYNIHMRTHNRRTPLKCPLCERTFKLKKVLKRHLQVNHGQKDLEGSNFSNLKTEGELKEEWQDAAVINDAKALAVNAAQDLDETQVKELMKQAEEGKQVERCQCEHCGKDFSSRGGLKVHYGTCPNLDEETRKSKGYKIIKAKKKLICEICNKTIVGEINFNHHLSLHSTERNFICDICPATFTNAYYLDLHKYRHKKGKWRQCDSCDKSFSATGDLKRHIMRMHTDERPFQCPHCTFTTVAKFYLDRHMRSHTGETPYKCNLCGKMYREKKSVKRHITAHHGYCDEKYIGINRAPPKIHEET